ncbi:unnamed protein product [Paramecium sonneborni]|uniref:Uncharacterized protein n=1 Tax=Paramecium sonneborni TaxID=65129 RepID=A0A8S1QJE0_9CILI|nr:unnamed protein product [Paramecium sonneborni]
MDNANSNSCRLPPLEQENQKSRTLSQQKNAITQQMISTNKFEPKTNLQNKKTGPAPSKDMIAKRNKLFQIKIKILLKDCIEIGLLIIFQLCKDQVRYYTSFLTEQRLSFQNITLEQLSIYNNKENMQIGRQDRIFINYKSQKIKKSKWICISLEFKEEYSNFKNQRNDIKTKYYLNNTFENLLKIFLAFDLMAKKMIKRLLFIILLVQAELELQQQHDQFMEKECQKNLFDYFNQEKEILQAKLLKGIYQNISEIKRYAFPIIFGLIYDDIVYQQNQYFVNELKYKIKLISILSILFSIESQYFQKIIYFLHNKYYKHLLAILQINHLQIKKNYKNSLNNMMPTIFFQ